MPKRFSFILGVFTIALIPLFSMAASEEFDLVINNGRVMDPESGLDAIRHIGIIAGRMVSISEQVLEGERIINATGLVVAPGFVDIHAHGQSEEAYRLMVQDGVTFGPIPNWVTESISEGSSGDAIALKMLSQHIKDGFRHFYLVPGIHKGGRRDYKSAQKVIDSIKSMER